MNNKTLPRVSACIVTWHCYERCRETVASLLAHTKGCELTLYIVDNCSGDGTLEKLKAEFPSIVPIQNSDNLGFGHGHNTVLPLLQSDYHAIVNPDILLERDSLSELADFLEQNPDIGLCSPRILNEDGSEQPIGKRNPTVAALVGRHLFKKLLKKEVDHYLMLDEDLSQVTDIGFASGCFIFLRTELFRKIGGFDERFFMYYEDMDITRRAAEHQRTVYCPFTSVTHKWERASSHSVKYFAILVIGMFRYFGKWGWQFFRKKEKAVKP